MIRWLAAVLAAVTLTLAGCGEGTPGSDGATVADAVDYTCPMHPQIHEDHPGDCPICGMDLVPANAMGGPAEVAIDPTVVQNMGIRTAQVVRGPITRHIRTIGEIEVGEDQVSVVNLRFSGWVERIYADRTGDEVRRGEALFEIYSPELVAAQEELLLAIHSSGPDSVLATSAGRRLELMGVDPRDIGRIVDNDEAMRTVPIRAPQGGFVLHKDVVQGARVEEGQDLYRIGNLTKIWVTAEVYEFDAPWVEIGQPAQMELSFQEGPPLEGRVSYIYPTLDPQSRTLTVRLEFDNPGLRLKPGMFATVTIQVQRRDDALVVPTEAILHSGTRELVFVTDGPGRFLAREVRTGLSGAHHLTEVVEGLAEGDEVVVSGQFLIDSESQLHEAVQKLMAHPHGDVGHASEPLPEGETDLYVCPMHPEERAQEPGRCGRCGMFLEKVQSEANSVPEDEG